MRRLPALACLVLLSLPLAGCWVIDELDNGKKLMDDHSAKPKDKEKGKDQGDGKVAATKPGKPGARLDAYFGAEEKAGTIKSFAPGQVNEGIVACQLGGSTQFMKREECASRGGRAN